MNTIITEENTTIRKKKKKRFKVFTYGTINQEQYGMDILMVRRSLNDCNHGFGLST